MTEKLYISLDFFQAAAYYAGSNVDLEPDESRYLYVVLQPFLISNFTDPAFRTPDLKDYLQTWTGTKFTQGDHAAVLGGPTTTQLLTAFNSALAQAKQQHPNNPEKWPSFIPVVFPPNTKLKFGLSWNGLANPVFIERTIGGATPSVPFVAQATDWPQFAWRNYLIAIIKDFNNLNPDPHSQVLSRQQREVLTWTYDLALRLRRDLTNLTPVEKKIYEEFFDATKLAPKTEDQKLWQEYLQQGTPRRVQQIFALLWEKFGSGELSASPRLVPPRLKYMPDDLKNRTAKELFGKVYGSYHESLWENIRSLFSLGKSEDDVRKEVCSAFGRLFGFGERLRWPRPKTSPTDDRQHFMIVGGDDRNGTDPQGRTWLVTNAHSLAGQVFRIGPFDPATPVTKFEIEGLKLQDTVELLTDDSTTENGFEAALLALYSNVVAVNARQTKFLTEVSRSNSKSQVKFLPKNASAPPTKVQVPTGTTLKDLVSGSPLPPGKPIFAVPNSLLDLLEDHARVDFPPGNWEGWSNTPEKHPHLHRLTAPRLLLDPKKDLYGAKADEDVAYQTKLWAAFRPLIQVKALLERIPLAAVKKDAAGYRLSLTGELHERDLEVLRRCLAKANLRNSVELWLQSLDNGGTGVVPYALTQTNVLESDVTNRPTLTILDADGSLTKLLPPQTVNENLMLDLVCIADSGKQPFNWLVHHGTTAPESPLLVLREDFSHCLNFSVEQISDLFKTSPAVTDLPPTTPNPEPVLQHFANFNKLRLWVQPKDDNQPPGPGFKGVPLNHPDALIPAGESPTPVNPGDRFFPDFQYNVVHLFSEQVRDTAIEAEDARYRLYRYASDELKFRGTIEHQYGFQTPVTNNQTHRLRLATDIRNPASLSFHDTSTGTPLHVLHFDHTPGNAAAPLDETIKVSFKRAYFAELIKEFLQDDTVGASPHQDQSRPARLRQVYEALMELADKRNAVTLHLERWNFDNRLNITPGKAAGDPDANAPFPSIADNLCFMESGTASFSDIHLRNVRNLLADSFGGFVENLREAVGKNAPNENHPLWTESIKISLKESEKLWAWPTSNSERYPVYGTTDVVRLGLRIRRPVERTIAADDLSTAEFLPLEPDKNSVAQTLLPKLAPLSDEAQIDFKKYLETPPANSQDIYASPLHQKFDWIVSHDEDAPPVPPGSDPLTKHDEERKEKLFGEILPQLNFPTNLRGPYESVVDIYYVLYAFKPLLAHPAFRDPQTTQEFVMYLLLILDDLVMGNPLTRVQVKGQLEPEEAIKFRKLAAQYLSEGITVGPQTRPGIAQKLLEFLVRVDNIKDQPAGGLFEKVDKLAELTITKGWWGDTLRSLISARPSVYATSKAIVTGIFCPDTFTERLHSLQITKQIRRPKEKSAEFLKQKDTDRFVFTRFLGEGNTRFFVDVLDDASYDNDFEIEQHAFQHPDNPPYGEKRKARDVDFSRRGTTLARSGEDLIEQTNYFEQAGPQQRLVEANVIHYNDKWIRKTEDQRIIGSYMLPSRRFPSMPKTVKPQDQEAAVTKPRLSIPEENGTVVRLENLFAELLQGLPSDVHLSVSDGGKELEFKPLPLTQAKPQNIDECGPWYQTESYLSNSYFIIEPDEEGQEPFKDDIFEIETEIQDDPFIQGPMAIEVKDIKPVSKLQQWFVYENSRKEGEVKTEEPPKLPDVTVEEVLKEIQMWFLTPEEADQTSIPTGTLGLLRTENPQMLKAAPAAEKIVVRYLRDRQSNKWKIMKLVPDANKVGATIASEIFKFSSDGTSHDLYLLRVSVLDQPWRFTRTRVRLIRNVRDENGDDVSDINNDFAMFSPNSDWVNYGRFIPRLDVDTMPEIARSLYVQPAAVTFEQWVKSQPAERKNFGPIVENMMKKQFKTDRGLKSLWNFSEATKANRLTGGLVLQRQNDNHPRQTLENKLVIGSNLLERSDEIAKQHLPPVMANKLGDLTKGFSKDYIRTAYPYLKVMWMTSEGNTEKAGERVLEATWPIRWK